jgi:hypothetical protein
VIGFWTFGGSQSHGGGLPPIPSRAEKCAIRTHGMQGLRLTTAAYGDQPWWEVSITSPQVTEAERLASYAQKRNIGDTCQIIALSWNYQAPGLVAPFAGRDLWNDIPTLRTYILEALQNGMTNVLLMLAGDGEDYSPDGWTYGYQNLMDQFPRIYEGLKDLSPYIVWCPGFDGVVPGWAGPNDDWHRVEDWLLFCRSVVGNDATMALELSAGYWCWTETNRYSSPGGQCLDVVLYEFPVPFGPVLLPVPPDFCNQPNDIRAPFDQVWQVSKRLLGSGWRRPSDMPACDDPGMAPNLPVTPRGPIATNAFEIDTYDWVRGRLTQSQLNDMRAYLWDCGWQDIG